MESKLVLLFTFVLLSLGYVASAIRCEPGSLNVSAFNVRSLGPAKMEKSKVVERLVQIIKGYDLIMIQEIRGEPGAVLPKLVNMVNTGSGAKVLTECDARCDAGQTEFLGPPSSRSTYRCLLSEKLGRRGSTYTERYGFIYRLDKVIPTRCYEYQDLSENFARRPFVVTFRRKDGGYPESFNFIPLHATASRQAISEMNALVDVYDNSVKITRLQDAMIAGDLNADCNYVKPTDWRRVKLRRLRRFTWKIADSADTTVSWNTNCAYDRIITTGRLTANTYGAGVFNFSTAYPTVSYDEAQDVSDHYPVEICIGRKKRDRE